MDEILHHLNNPGVMLPLEIPTNNGLLWFQSGAGFRPSTVRTNKSFGLTDFGAEDEIEQEEVRKQVAKEQAAAPKMLPGLVALQAERRIRSVACPMWVKRVKWMCVCVCVCCVCVCVCLCLCLCVLVCVCGSRNVRV